MSEPFVVLIDDEPIPQPVLEAYSLAVYVSVYRNVTPADAALIRSGFTLGRYPLRTWDDGLSDGDKP